LSLLPFALAASAAFFTTSAQAHADDSQPLIKRDRVQLNLSGAQRAIAASVNQAEQMGVKQGNICELLHFISQSCLLSAGRLKKVFTDGDYNSERWVW